MRRFLHEDTGEWRDGRGNVLVYGTFGPDTYGLITTLDGREYELCIRAHVGDDLNELANALLDKLATGWRPVNW